MLTIAPLDATALTNRGITARLRTCSVACRLELRSPLWSDAAKANFAAWAAMLEEAADEIDRLRLGSVGPVAETGRSLDDFEDEIGRCVAEHGGEKR